MNKIEWNNNIGWAKIKYRFIKYRFCVEYDNNLCVCMVNDASTDIVKIIHQDYHINLEQAKRYCQFWLDNYLKE